MLRPVTRKLIRYESLLDGTVDLVDIALLNDAIDVQSDNERLMNEYLERNRDHG